MESAVRTNDDAVRVVQQAFPDIPPDQIAADVLKLIKELEDKGLVRRHTDRMNPALKKA